MKSVNNNKRKMLKEALKSGYAFMHIPKTGGSSLAAMYRKIQAAGHRTPAKLTHKDTLSRIIAMHPNIKVCFVLRDPIERAASGFLSRMRMGRPTYNRIWQPNEAIAFSFFEDPKSLLRALASDDERLKSAAYFAFKHISHLRSNYLRYFESVDMIESNLHRFAVVGDMNRYDDFVLATVKMADPSIDDLSPYYTVKHVYQQKSTPVMDGFTDVEKEKIQAFFAKEYTVYNRLKELINC